MGGLTTTHIYYLMVLEPRSLKSRYLQGHTPSEASREESSVPLPASVVPRGPWLCQHNTNLCFPFTPVASEKFVEKISLKSQNLPFAFVFHF